MSVRTASLIHLLPRAAFLAPMVALAACGGSNTQTSNSVTMRDMDVQDGTSSDSMTDLDAARIDGTPLENPVANNAAKPATDEAGNASAAKQPGDSEVVADD